ncbi:MAG TPA: bifunctional riboflavin kinase/FAD synthetase [Pseudogracilibacillus sp.]|nr:bifunctional riboflavin kinase/FAD synthetase [Pseudogracilibacillus sp.]
MQIIELSYPVSLSKESLPKTVAALGFFDGIHQGHRAVIGEAVDIAQKQHKECAVITFHPHPSVVLKQTNETVQYITTIDEKAELLSEMGVDRLYIITFNKTLSKLSPEEFIKHFIVDLHIEHVVAGFDFSFGHKGKGNMKNIHSFGFDQFTTTVIDKIELEDEKVSSTNIRKALHIGDVEEVHNLLDRPYETSGKVITGAKRGRQLGFPTANIAVSTLKLLPKQGVYAVTIDVKDKLYKGMANLGVNPTFVEGKTIPSLEVYIFDFEADIYEEEVTVYWYKHMRDEKKFNGVDEIVNQLTEDEKQIRAYFNLKN